MHGAVLVLAAACASCLAAPGRLSADQQTRDAVDEYARWRDTRKPVVGHQDDVAQETEDLRQQFEDIEQHFAEMGQQLESVGQETGQRTVDVGQQLEVVRQLVLASTPAARVSLSEEDVGQVLDTPSSTQRPMTSRPVNRANPVQMQQRASSSPRTPTVHQIVQESDQAIQSLDLLAGQQQVTQKPAARGDQISVSNEDVDAGQQLEKMSVSGEQQRVQEPTGKVSDDVSQKTCVDGIVIGSVCYQSWDSDEDKGVRATTGRPVSSTQRPVQTTPTPSTTTGRTHPPRLTAPVARAMSSARATTTSTVRPEITTTPARLSISEEQTDDQLVFQVVHQRPQQIRRKPKVVGQVDNSSEEDGQVYQQAEDLGQRPVAVQQMRREQKVIGQVENSSEEGGQLYVQPDNLGQRPVAVQQVPAIALQRPQPISRKPKVLGQVDNSSEETGQFLVQPDNFSQHTVAVQQTSTTTPQRPQQMRQQPKVVGQVAGSSEEGGQVIVQPDNFRQRPVAVQQLSTIAPQRPQQIRQLSQVVGQVENRSEETGQVIVQPNYLGQRPQAVQQPPRHYSQSSEEAGQVIYKPDFPEQRPARVTQVEDSSEDVGQVYQRPEVFAQQQRVTPSRPQATTTVRPAAQRRVGQLQDPNTEGSEELGRIASYIRDKVNEEQDEDYDAGQQTVQIQTAEWQNLRQLAQQVDVRAGQPTGQSATFRG